MTLNSPPDWQRILAAFMFATRLRLTWFDRLTPESHQQFRPFMPLVGGFVGALGALVFALSDTLLNNIPIAVVLSMAATILLTGALHEDGLADSCDAFGGHVSRGKALTIMKDSRLGTYGVCGLFVVLLLKCLALVAVAQTHSVWLFTLMYIAAHAFSRSLAIRTSWRLNYASTLDASKSEPVVRDAVTQRDKVLCLALGATPLAMLATTQFYLTLGALGLAVLGAWRVEALSEQRIQGYTGDVLGAVQQVSELGFYLGVLILMVPAT
ncbi:adenosylcobinamide-GDP ribazoletransferase [Arenicella chitinivorans]|uniref:Adenosylcobinamide-GDP ribazoletransferase n=1 Tax=Arenicella chitinivorans TaxID=1329800 RepID=A0A918RL38_9GAMM|nr:adenosylcobinamide-GDP ribazoletransferase [Arenicella chitinivorans]GHA02420.1 adenosylcobinamide-GDP ribazoletransferase [Arenicella chitinivorans]